MELETTFKQRSIALEEKQFPQQSDCVGTRTQVLFLGLLPVAGTLVRDDTEEPFIQIVELDNGKYITGKVGTNFFT